MIIDKNLESIGLQEKQSNGNLFTAPLREN